MQREYFLSVISYDRIFIVLEFQLSRQRVLSELAI